MGAVVAPSAAQPIERGTINDTFDAVYENFCGVPGLTVADVGSIQVRYRVNTHGRDQIPYYAENVRETSTVTDLSTDKSITYAVVTNGKDLRIVDNGDDTISIIGFGTGNFTVWGEDGKALGRNPGQFREQVLIDTNGTPDDFFDDELLGQEVIKPSTGRTDDMCAAMLTGLGIHAP